MAQEDIDATDTVKKRKKDRKGNMLLLVIISCWLLFYLYMGSLGGGG